MKPWQVEVLSEILKDHINSEALRRSKALERSQITKKAVRESEARYRIRIETLHQIYKELTNGSQSSEDA